MDLVQVGSKKTEKLFLKAAREIYHNDPNWICPLDRDIKNIFNPSFNQYFIDGEAIRWIVTGSSGELLGRVAAFYHRKRSYRYEIPVGGIGFFECVDNDQVAKKLFDAAAEWLTGKGMKAMDGPINFGENDNYWGLLVEGFTPPAFGMNYHPPYYREFFEEYGFKPFYTQITKYLDLNVPFPERFWKIADWVRKKAGYSFQHFNYRQIDKFVNDLKEIHDQAWQFHEHFIPLDRDLIHREFIRAKPILIGEFIWFVYHKGQPVAFFVMLPDANQIFRHLNGKLHFLNKLRFLYFKWNKEITRTRVTIMGVIPKFQGQGLESAIFWHLRRPVLEKRPHIREIEISWVGDFNPKMQATLEAVGANPGKKHITYRKIFDSHLEFQAAKKITPES
jgi:GNAT superfamily N-acetyltransferase